MPRQEIAINTLPFWSRFTLTYDLRFDPATGLVRTQFPAGFSIPVFDYRKGEQSVAALEGGRATPRDTILVQANQTRGGGLYRIHGISFTKDGWAYEKSGDGNRNGLIHTLYPPSSSQPGNNAFGPQVPTPEDFRALDSLSYEVFQKYFRMEVQIDGTRRILEMGPTILYPGVAGPVSDVDTVNGAPFVVNFMKIREGITWNPSGAVDSNLLVALQAAYDCVTPTWTTPAGTADGEAPGPDNPLIPNAQPTSLGRQWTSAWIVNFHGYEESPTSNIS
jgi:hypothetical protein